jgi:Ca2+-binding EF-hand superfamily protein
LIVFVVHTRFRILLLNALHDYFDSIDEDGSGEIDARELSIAMCQLGQVEFSIRRQLAFFDDC